MNLKKHSVLNKALNAGKIILYVYKNRGFGLAVFSISEILQNLCSAYFHSFSHFFEWVTRPLASWAYHQMKKDRKDCPRFLVPKNRGLFDGHYPLF